MMKETLLVVAPGRGSYSKATMGVLQNRSSPKLTQIDMLRAQQGRITPSEIDALPRFQASKHLAGEEASLLTAACSIADFDDISQEHYDIIGVCGNSMGHYTALILSAVLSLDDGVQLIDTMGAYQRDNVIGGQLVYPLCDENWHLVDSRVQALQAALHSIPDLYVSISLGYQCILAGSTTALKQAQKHLPSAEISGAKFPIQLPMHSAFHSPLLKSTSEQALQDLPHLSWSQPQTPLIGGYGQLWKPLVSDPLDIATYTLTNQVYDRYNFSAMIQNAVSLLAPDKIALLGPGSNLGGAIIQSLIEIGWYGIHSKADFMARQQESPILLSMGRPEQKAQLCR